MKNGLEIYDKSVFHGRWKVELQRETHNVPSLQATTDSPESILPHQKIRFLALIRQQDLSISLLISVLDLCGVHRVGKC